MRSSSLKSSILQFSRFCALAHFVTSSNACSCRPFVSHSASNDGLTLGMRTKSMSDGMTFSFHSFFTKSAAFLQSIV